MNIKRNPDVAWRTVEGQAVLIHNREGVVQVLNEVGTYVWEHFDEGVERITSGLAELYEVSPDMVKSDVQEFMRELSESQLILES